MLNNWLCMVGLIFDMLFVFEFMGFLGFDV